mgnify:CR=1 FL=1
MIIKHLVIFKFRVFVENAFVEVAKRAFVFISGFNETVVECVCGVAHDVEICFKFIALISVHDAVVHLEEEIYGVLLSTVWVLINIVEEQ